MFEYSLTGPIGHKAILGLIVLQADETLEPELMRLLLGDGVALYTARVPSGADVTPETLAAMADEIPTTAELLPPSLDFDAIAYGCTSGATVIGPDRVTQLVQGAARAQAVTNPLSAVLSALQALGAQRIGMVTPYVESVTGPMREVLEAKGISVARCISFEEPQEARVARIDPVSIRAAGIAAGEGGVDAVFLSCTNLRTLDVINEIEQALGCPVISSNLALAWQLARLSGTTLSTPVGRLSQV